MRVLSIPTSVAGRVLIEDAPGAHSGHMLVGCHGYAQNAAIMLDEMRRIPGADRWRLVSVQALHRFYRRADETVVASWMTREDRDQAIIDNIRYLDRAVAAAGGDDARSIVFLGFSQGASMAARAAARGARRAAGLVLLGGDIAADVKDTTSVHWPRVLVGCGTRDTWYGARVESDLAFLQSRGIPHDVVRFEGGHEITDELRAALGAWLSDQLPPV